MNNQTKKVLIVEDDKDFLWMLRQSFEIQGITIVYAEDGEAGIVKAQEENPDLILVDISLPKMDGITMAKKMREQGVKSSMIFLTNMKDMDHISQALEAAGESDYIVKSDMRIDAIITRVKDKLGIK